MGLGGLRTAWQRQTKDFGHTQSSEYSVLLLDNRGIGESSKPLMRYSTSEMALDIVEVLSHISWTQPRSLNIVGISMGGMIAQELALLIPERVHSLVLVSTAARLVNTIGFFENLRNRINMFVPRSLDQQIARVKPQLYTEAWLEGEDDTECVVEKFPSNGDRWAAGEVDKRMRPEVFNRVGFMAQAIAAGWHSKTPEQLKELGDKVRRDRICVVHGTEDRMITFPHAEVLVTELGGEEAGVEKRYFEGLGHVIPAERRKEFHELLEGMVKKGQALNG